MTYLNPSQGASRLSGKLMISAAVFTLGLFLAGPVLADDHRDRDDHRREPAHDMHDREWREHERRAHRWHEIHPVLPPQVIYAPPAVVYTPPPISPGLTLVIPLDIR